MTVAAAAAFLAFAAAPAAAVERVADGNFESTTCSGACTSPAWSTFLEGGAAQIGPLCGDPAFAGGAARCALDGSGYTSKYHWARLGSSTGHSGEDREPDFTNSISQSVLIPTATFPGSPATLRFNLHIVNALDSTGTFRATVDGLSVFSVTDATSGYNPYHQVTVDVSPFAGPGVKTLGFEATEQYNGSTTAGTHDTDTFDVDDVSLDAANLPTAAAPAPGPTGQRAAALAKCKHKHGKAKKRCKKRASPLPL